MADKIKFWGPTLLALLVGLAMVAGVVWFSNKMSREIKKESEAMAMTFVKTTKFVSETPNPDSQSLSLALDLIKGNTSVPVMYCNNPFKKDQNEQYEFVYRNIGEDANRLLDKDPEKNYQKLCKKWEWMGTHGYPVRVYYDDKKTSYQTVYYADSKLLTYANAVSLLPFAAAVIFLFFAYLVVRRRQLLERDNLWKGLALETAHQLGTPITGLKGWHDLLETGDFDTHTIATEMEKDIERLASVSNRFQHIGSKQKMESSALNVTLRQVVEYIDHRTSKRIHVRLDEQEGEVMATHDPTLISWSVENICKNAADAIGAEAGNITVFLRRRKKGGATIDIVDNGKGMSATTQRHVFDAGYTTKARGWGMGLALVKRIVNTYHNGNVFVMSSEPGKGTTFRIELKG